MKSLCMLALVLSVAFFGCSGEGKDENAGAKTGQPAAEQTKAETTAVAPAQTPRRLQPNRPG